MRRRDPAADDDSQPVMVPRSERVLVPTPPERARRLRKHLIVTLRSMKDRDRPTANTRPEPVGFMALVAQAACTLCKGSCCKGGGDHAYLDEQTMARTRRARPDLGRRAIVRLYVDRVPTTGYDGSCLFHGARGCTLTRSLRSDVCNNYFCAGLEAYVTGGDPETHVLIIAGEGDGMRTSPVLKPR
jgi:hypothetical protein